MQAVVAVVSWLRSSLSPSEVEPQYDIPQVKEVSTKKRKPPTCTACRKHENIVVLRKNHICPYHDRKKKKSIDSEVIEIDNTIQLPESEEDKLVTEYSNDHRVLGKRSRKPSDEDFVPSDEDSEEDELLNAEEPPRKKPKSQVVVIHPTNDITTPPSINQTDLEGEIIRIPKERLKLADSVLGSGAFGHVKTANFDGAPVAAKILFDDKALEQEARFMQNLRHPNILQYYGCCLPKNCLYYCMLTLFKVLELCEGDLSAVMQSLDNDTVLSYARGIASGIQYLHNEDITHRDLKPGNILLQGGVPKLADFGISKRITAANNTRIGTPHYMAPEMFKGQYGKEVDIYAFGLILYEMMSRSRVEDTLFNDKQAFQVYEMVSVQQVRPTLPRRWKARVRSLLQNMWHEDIQKRFSVEQTIRGLARLLPTDFPPSQFR